MGHGQRTPAGILRRSDDTQHTQRDSLLADPSLATPAWDGSMGRRRRPVACKKPSFSQKRRVKIGIFEPNPTGGGEIGILGGTFGVFLAQWIYFPP